MTGQGVQNFFVATPGLAPIGSVPAPGNSMTPAGSAGGYSYGY